MVEVRHKGKKPNKDAISGNVPWSVLWCVRASEFAPTPSTEAGLSFFHSYTCQSLAKGMATSGTLAHCMWGESGTSSPRERLHRGSQVLEVRIKGTQNPEERCMEIGKGLWGHLGEAPTLSVISSFSDFWRALALAQLTPISKMSFPWFINTGSLENLSVQTWLMGGIGA